MYSRDGGYLSIQLGFIHFGSFSKNNTGRISWRPRTPGALFPNYFTASPAFRGWSLLRLAPPVLGMPFAAQKPVNEITKNKAYINTGERGLPIFVLLRSFRRRRRRFRLRGIPQKTPTRLITRFLVYGTINVLRVMSLVL